MRFNERRKEQVTNQTVIGILRMMIRLIRIRGTTNHLVGIMPMRDLYDKERQHSHE